MDLPVLVTGGTGFIGRHLVSSLLAQHRQVRLLVRNRDHARDFAAMGVDVVAGDMHDSTTLSKASANVGGIYHLAGKLFAPGPSEVEYWRLHVDATVALLRASAQAGRPGFFVLCSTTGVHGPTGARPAREEDQGHPQNAYERSKVESERAATVVARELGIPLVIARPGLVYGPGDHHLLGWYRAIQAGTYRVVGPGTNHLHPIFIDDAVRGLLLCAAHADTAGPAFHLVGARAFTMRELSEAIGAAVGRAIPARHLPAPLASLIGAFFEALPVPRRILPLTRSRVQFMLQNRVYDGQRARGELGFEPMTGLTDGLSRTVAWYRANSLL